jgi:flavin-dependent dehydrogenase
LIGDAAAFTDPIFSIGVVIAMYSGYLSAWAIDEALKAPVTAERNRALFAAQMRSWIEVSRALACRATTRPRLRDRAREHGLPFQSEQELMRVVSMMTTALGQLRQNGRFECNGASTRRRFGRLDQMRF